MDRLWRHAISLQLLNHLIDSGIIGSPAYRRHPEMPPRANCCRVTPLLMISRVTGRSTGRDVPNCLAIGLCLIKSEGRGRGVAMWAGLRGLLGWTEALFCSGKCKSCADFRSILHSERAFKIFKITHVLMLWNLWKNLSISYCIKVISTDGNSLYHENEWPLQQNLCFINH